AGGQQLAVWINTHSTHGHCYEYFHRDQIMNDLGLTAEELGMAASELQDTGYVKLMVDSGSGPARFSRVYARPHLFFETDRLLHGWNPRQDAVALAAA